MSKILDQYGRPLDSGALEEPQTANVTALQAKYLTPMLAGLTPARLARTLHAADMGDLSEQHRLFADMEERDTQIQAEMAKRKNALLTINWDIVPPRNASAAEKSAAEWVKEVLLDAVDPCEDLFLAMMDAVGHGFAPIELEWRQEGKERLPSFHPRPQEWFQMNQARTAIHLQDYSVDGAELQPFGWIMHTPSKAKTGYSARMGLFRTLVWPFLYKSYALGDFAEFLETFGLPIIVGKYFSGASADEKASLMRAVTQLGHDARAIMPKEMELEINKVTGGAGEAAHLQMMDWADRAISKSILGQTLSSDTGKGGGGSYALGHVHNEVRHDIRNSDARQIAATVTRDLIFPMIAVNQGGVDGLKRCPRLVFDLGESEDLTKLADALPKLVAVGFSIPKSWAQEKANIPLPQEGEDVLKVAPAAAPEAPAFASLILPPGVAALSSVPAPAEAVLPQLDDPVNTLAGAAAPTWQAQLDRLRDLVDAATDLNALQDELLQAFGGFPEGDLVRLMGAAFALAELKGMVDVQEGR